MVLTLASDHHESFRHRPEYRKIRARAGIDHHDALDLQVRLIDHEHSMSSVAQQQVAEGLGIFGIMDGQLNGCHFECLWNMP
jgi:hypothetical protein